MCPRGQRLAGTLRFAHPTQHVTNNVSILLQRCMHNLLTRRPRQHVTNNVSILLQQDMLEGWRLIEGLSPNGW